MIMDTDGLAQKLDQELDEFVNSLEKTPYTGGWTEENWEEDIEQHPFFMSKPVDPSTELPAAIEGLRQLKWDEDMTPEERVQNYREEGNEFFARKKYRDAVTAYTDGLRQKCPDKATNATLYSNRAAAHFRLGNYRSSLKDCVAARKMQSEHMKAILKGAECLIALEMPQEAIQWCETGLWIDGKHPKLLELRKTAEKRRSELQRENRVKEQRKRKEQQDEDLIRDALKIRNIQVPDEIVRLPTGDHLHLDSNGVLLWPVVLLYPESGQSDLLQAVVETESLKTQIDHVLAEPPPWDEHKRHRPDRVNVFYEDDEDVPLDPTRSIKELFAGKKVLGGVVKVLVVPKK